MRHDDTVEVVVLDGIEELHTILHRKILLAGIEDAGIGIGGLVGGGNLCHVRLQSDNHRLLRHAETLHLMCRHTHNERLARAYLVVTDASTVLL